MPELTGLLFVACWVGLVVWLSRVSSRDDADAADAFARAAAKLRLAADGFTARGHLDVPLELELRRTREVLVTASIEPSLAMGLAIKPRRGALLLAVERLSPGFDSAFELEAMDPGQAIELVKGDVGRLLIRADALGLEASVSDDSVTLRVPPFAGVEQTVAAARAANDLAVHLLSRRPHLRASSVERALAKALQAVGKRLDAVVEPRVGRLELTSQAGRLSLRIERTPDGSQSTRLRFHFARRLPAGLSLSDERQRSDLGRLLDPDIETNDAELDAAFVVRGESADEVRALLDPASRQALLRLWRSVHTLSVDEHEIDAWLPVVLTDPRKLLALIEALTAAAGALSRHAVPPAYR